MKIIVGAGSVGLSIAYKILLKYKRGNDIVVIDRYNLPTKGTSLKNSGVLHAGLYYPPKSEKSKLCIDGHEQLKKLCFDNNLPILKCGKIILPINNLDYERITDLYINASSCNRHVSIIDFNYAKKIQPNINQRNSYLWSPETSVFSPSSILEFLYKFLLNSGVKFIKDKVELIDNEKQKIITSKNQTIKFTKLFNCAGPGSLNLYKKNNLNKSHLTILPILGQYAIMPSRNILKTNLYPAPDPTLPFLGVHLTPMINGNILIGPNAVPVFKKDVQGFEFEDFLTISSKLFNHAKLFLNNSQNYRKHALNELSFNVLEKFKNQVSQFIKLDKSLENEIFMDNTLSGIRPQLYDYKKNKLINDFVYEKEDNVIHIINAVSPAFTSCLSLADKIININI
tara:strand:- start:232 stop:1422 length:1191 start_codon:yes stop_codon:yes gene_type:complete